MAVILIKYRLVMRIATSVVVNAFLVIMETKDSWDSTNQTQKFQLNTVGKDISTQKNATPLGFLLSPCFLFSVKKMNIALQKVPVCRKRARNNITHPVSKAIAKMDYSA
eukprot:CAMPEP_0206207720 /NCGR_PEP_ID=MMETSP0166-20121206/15766_1 /ASSEMBLY_ACC=CAM_ASM_000260 /TAXON_ID=95228 /ORGANISM="Vannella robusta, Strain DIVA3 518/3/11/1/6" /LENGTH=108 /DNA_ID=CAMNT_0053628549 /DNA_START=90 /DNA_END=416 /DNA_ORIENTATION=+